MIVGKDSRQIAVSLNSLGPVFLSSRAGLVLLRSQTWIGTWWRRRGLADVIGDLTAIAERIQRRDDRFPVRTFPDAHVEGNAHRSFLWRVRSADVRGRLPRG